MNAQFDLTDSSNLSAKKRTGKASWKVGRILYLALVLIGTVVAYFLPSLPYQPPLCLFKLMTGFPCAGCGMTRAFEAAARGRFREAFEWHPIGLMLFVAAWLGVVVVVYELLTNKPFDWDRWLQRWGIVFAWSLFIALLALWLLRLSYYRIGQWLPLPLKVPL
jgi:multisubunit Na+/H+ antiporter MnhB subunit